MLFQYLITIPHKISPGSKKDLPCVLYRFLKEGADLEFTQLKPKQTFVLILRDWGVLRMITTDFFKVSVDRILSCKWY